MIRSLTSIALAVSLACSSGHVLALAGDQAMAPTHRESKTLYWQGHDALKRADWNEAQRLFQSLEQQLREAEPKSVDAALYWQAYALQQAGRQAEARATLERLQREYPNSRWKAQAESLAKAVQTTGSVSLADDELAEAALEGLLAAPPQRAIPLLRKLLDSDRSLKLKKRALFVLSQTGDPAAMDTVLAIARNHGHALQNEAIEMLGVSGGKQASEALTAVYADPATRPETRRRVLNAWLVSGDKTALLRAAQQEQDAKLRRNAIELLGAMGAGAELQQLQAASKDAETRRAIINAYGISGDVPRLREMARSDPDPRLRADALRALGVAGAGDALQALYAEASSPELRDAALQGLMIAGDSQALLQLYRNAKTAEEKKAVLRILTLTGGDEALDAIEAALQ